MIMAEIRKLCAGLDTSGQPVLFYVDGGKTSRVSRDEWASLLEVLGVEIGDMPLVELIPPPSKEFERLSVLVGRLQAILASEGDLSVTVWDSDHSTWCDQPGLYLEVVDNTDGMGGLVHEGIEHSRFLGIR